MKKLLLIPFLCATIILPAEPNINSQDRIQEFAKDGCRLIDALFAHARSSVVAQEDIMTKEWMIAHGEIGQLQNLSSDMYFELDCKQHNATLLTDLLTAHVYNKMEQETGAIFEVENISRRQAHDFFEFAHTICKLTGARGCGRKMREIRSSHFDKELKFDIEETFKRQVQKEEAQQLRDSLVFGGNRKKEVTKGME